MQSEFRIMDYSRNWVEFPETIHDARLGVLVGGRPFNFGPSPIYDWQYMLVIWQDDGSHHVDIPITDVSLSLSDTDFKKRVIEPAIECIDGCAYPERQKRFIAASREYARQFTKAA